MIRRAHLILFVADQAASSRFYAATLKVVPSLDVPGMTELPLSDGAVLGLMPQTGIRRLLGGRLPAPAPRGAPVAELYLVVDEPAAYHARALAAGGTELSALLGRDWGHEVAYSLDPDGHIVAFARSIAL